MPSSLRDSLGILANGVDLTPIQCREAIAEMIGGEAEPAQVAAFLTALRIKGETADELAGAIEATRERMIELDIPASCRPLLDTCGTGGDGARSVNISTATALVVASCGVRVAKHGNRSASGNSGSSEVLSELGVKINSSHPILIRCLRDLGITFLFAPAFHPALRHVGPIRRSLPFRTLFNLVGPLANPARPDLQLIGTPAVGLSALIARAMGRLRGDFPVIVGPVGPVRETMNDVERAGRPGPRRAFVVTGSDGLDEVTLAGTTFVTPIQDGPADHADRTPISWEPTDFGLPIVHPSELAVSGPGDSAAKIRAMLAGEAGAVRSVVLANAAASLLLAEKAETLGEGVALAAEAIDRGAADRLLVLWARLSQSGD